MKWNIALCYECVDPSRGGAEHYICDLSQRLIEDGHDVHLYCRRWHPQALPRGLTLHPIELGKTVRFLKPFQFGAAVYRALQNQPHDLTLGFDKTWGQDILYPQGGFHRASAVYNLRKFPNFWTRTWARLGKWLDPAAWLFPKLEDRQYRQFQPFVIVNSHMVHRHLRDYYPERLPRSRVIYSAINASRFQVSDAQRHSIRQEIRQRLQIPEGTTTGLFIAMNYRLKGLSPLLLAVAALPQSYAFQLLVIGHPEDERYQRQARQLGLASRIKFQGFQADPRDYYFAADFLIHPTFYDPCSLVALEALAAELPVITSQYNGAQELLGEAGQVLQDPHDKSELARALLHYGDAASYELAKQAARRVAQQISFERHYQELLALFADVVREKQLKSPVS